MRMVQILPGVAGAFYCENCIRDQTLVRELIRQGHDALVVPLYLPLAQESAAAPRRAPLFFGGINVYLQQKSAFFRRLPAWLTRPLDSPRLLRLAAGMASMMEPEDLGETTLSMLRGEDGRQAAELDRLVAWLASTEKPDVICLSNVLLVGMARRLRAGLRTPIVCMLQDEDSFLDELPESHREAAWDVLRERAAEVDAFVAVSRYFKGVMEKRLAVPPERIHVVHTGVPVAADAATSPPAMPTVGFLSRLCREKGLDLLVEAVIALRQSGRVPGLRLRVTGGHTPQDHAFIESVRRRLTEAGAESDAEFVSLAEGPERAAFFRGLSVFSVPEKRGEASGVCMLEALACGVPVIQQRHGVYPELVELTGGGLLYEPGDQAGLAAALERLLRDPAESRRMGEAGRQRVIEDFSPEAMVAKFVHVCEGISR